MMKNMRKRLLGCAIVLICFVAFAGLSYAAKSDAPKGKVAAAAKSQVEDALGVLAKSIAGKAPVDDKSAFALLKLHLSKNPDIYGAAYAFAPVKKDGKLVKSSPYVYRSGGKFIEKNPIDSYDYTVQDWYVLPVKAMKAVWSEPYFDKGGGEAWMITYSIPIYSGGKPARLIGVLTSDLLIPNK
jgi:hypothetical protein